MSLSEISPGSSAPEEINVVIEIPLNREPVKYEVDKDTSVMFVDRFLATAMHYPCNYGYVPQTLAGDGDPVDVMVVSPLPVISGSVVSCRPVGVLKMEDDGGDDKKVIAVPTDKLTSMYRDIRSVRDLPNELLDSISHFFAHYKDLEPGKWVKIEGWGDLEAAHTEIRESIERYNNEPG